MLDKETLKAYNATRKTADKSLLCHAPFLNLNFEQNGHVTACCYNRVHLLGSYPQDKLQDIWFGKKADELRTYIKDNNLEGGCHLCKQQLLSGNFHNSRMRSFDSMADSPATQTLKKTANWVKHGHFTQMPTCMEFELSNTCNLECVMCNGYFSSSIRKNREKAAPLTNPYDEAFVEQLIPFIPHLKDVKFLGGEPFLIDIYYQIWDLLVAQGSTAKVHITTNATVLNKRSKDLLEQLNCHIILSIDSIVPETYESIRQNARFDRVWENIQYFMAYTRRQGTYLNFAVCPITLNWHEMPELVRYCNQEGIHISFNTVTEPKEYSLKFMSAAELAEVAATYQSVTLPDDTEVSQHNRLMFNDMVSQVSTWSKHAAKVQELTQNAHEHFTQLLNSQPLPQQLQTPAWQSIATLCLSYMDICKNGEKDIQDYATEHLTTSIANKLKLQLDELGDAAFIESFMLLFVHLPAYAGISTREGYKDSILDITAGLLKTDKVSFVAQSLVKADLMNTIQNFNQHTTEQLLSSLEKDL